MVGCMTFSSGAGHTPTTSTASASAASTMNSRPLRSLSAADPRAGHRAEHHALHQPQRVGGAEHQRQRPRAAQYQKLALKLAMITRNSPTKPEVPGSPVLASANSTMKAANTGMVLTTPP